MSLPAEYEKPEGLRTLANYLRTAQNGVKSRQAVEHDKRVDYFKGKRLVDCILEAKKWPKTIPKIEDKATARLVAQAMVNSHFFHRSEKVEDKKGYLRISQKQVFEETGYFTWMYSGNMVWSNIATAIIIAAVISFTLLPVWPMAARNVLWYFSVTGLIIIFSFCFIRIGLFLFVWLFGYDFWIFPRLFDESLSFQDSFKPIVTFEKAANGQGWWRIGSIICLVAFAYWATTQPTEFDGLIQAQKDFIDDLYSGNLLADVPADPRTLVDRSKRVPSLEDLLRELENDDKEYITDKVVNKTAVDDEEDINNVGDDSAEEDAVEDTPYGNEDDETEEAAAAESEEL